MENERLKEDIEAIVTKIFSEKEQSDIRRKTEEALKKSAETISDLTADVEGKNEEIVGLNEEISNLNTKAEEFEEKIKNLEAELEAAKSEVETSNEKLTEVETALDTMKKEKVAEERMSVLEEAEVVTDADSQREKVMEMTDEEFSAYKEDRISLRKAVLAKIKVEEEKNKNNKPSNGTEGGSDTEESASGTEESAEEESESEDTAPANVDPNARVEAALNLETASDDMLKKYSELGKAMADNMVKKDK